MLQKHININELINIEGTFHNAVKPLECSKIMSIGKDKIYHYYKKFKEGKTIHERDIKYPNAKQNIEYGHYEGDIIIGERRKSAIVTIVEKITKCIILLKASRKSEDVKNSLND